MGFHNWEDFPQKQNIRKGTWVRVVSTKGLTVQRGRIDPGTQFDGGMHRHPEEQIILMLEGKFLLRLEDEEQWLDPGDLCAIPAGAFHGGMDVGPEGASYYEVLAPGKIDYLTGYVGPPGREFRGPDSGEKTR